MQVDPNNSIGVFDSGVGGLTVVKALIEQLPFENIIYSVTLPGYLTG